MYRNVAIGFLILYSVFCEQCSTPPSSSTSLESDNHPQSNQAVSVDVSIARKDTFYYRIACNGEINASESYNLVSQISGVIKTCRARDGAKFRKGQILLELETTPLKLQFLGAQSDIRNAEAEYQSRLLGYTSLLNGKTTEEIKSIKDKLQISSGLFQAKLNLRKIKWNLKQAIIRAPASGIIANVKVGTGMQINSGDKLFTLYTDSKLRADVLVMEEDIGKVHEGQRAMVTPIGDNAKTYPAIITGINPIIDVNGMVTVHLKLKETKGLYPGMHASAIIEVPQYRTVIIPRSALVLRSGDRPVVFTVEKDLAKWHYVKPGLDNGEEIEILDGISPGDTVITSNNIQLANNAPVIINHSNMLTKVKK